MDLRQLEYFAMVAKHSHFGHAAEELMITQPPLSQKISALERELRVKLLDRTTRRVELTDAGKVFYEHVAEILDKIEAARTEVSELAKGMRGVIRLGVIGSAMYLQLPLIVQALRDELPEAEIQIIPEFFTEGQIGMILDNRLDLGLVRNTSPHDDIAVEVLGYESLAVAVRNDDSINNAVTMQEVRNRTILTYPRAQSTIGRLIQSHLDSTGSDRPSFIEVPHTSSMLAMVAAGVGVAVVPESAAVLDLPGVRFARVGDLPQIGLELVSRRHENRALIRRAADVISAVDLHKTTPNARSRND